MKRAKPARCHFCRRGGGRLELWYCLSEAPGERTVHRCRDRRRCFLRVITAGRVPAPAMELVAA